MSAELVDERVVEMRFDNKDFEKNVGQSIKTINKLKDSLDFEESEKSFENISKAAERCDLKPLEKSLENVSVKFNMLEMVAAGVLTKIANEAVEAGTKFAKSLSIDQVTAGWSKYAQKTQAVQTIMSATGHTIDTINAKLEDLIWYADETSADFVDMINNIGKFTSAGVDLDTAANAMMGISNWAFISGANIQQASRAMYNLSQAIGMGYVGVQDWKSIELANMATLEFKETVIETALELGTLQMAADGTIKTMKGTEVTAENMRSSLKEQWFSGDVLNTALAKYSEFSNEVKKFQDDWEARTGEFLNVNKAIDKMIEMEMVDIDSLGYRAFRRAQEAITLNQAIAATADAASSGWMRTFEIIFGNYEQATKLWTDLANDMWDVFAGPLESQNEHLSEIMDSNYQKLLKSLPNGQEFNQSLYEKLFKMAEENLGPEAAAALFSKYDTLEELLRNETYYSSTLRTAFDEIAVDYDKEAKDAAKLTKTLESGQLTLQQAALRLAGGVYGKDIDTQRQIVEKMGFNYEYLSELAEAWKAGEDLPWDALQKDLLKTLKEEEAYYSDFAKAVRKINPFDDFIQSLKELGGRDKLLGGFQNVIDTFKNLYLTILAIKDGIGDFLGTGSFLSNLIDGFYKVSSIFAFTDEQFEELSTNIHDFFNGGLQKKWKEFWNGSYIQSSGKYYNALTGEYEQITSYVPGMLAKISEAYDQYIGRLPEEVAKTVDNIKNTITGYFGNLPQKIKDFKEKYLGHFEEKTIFSENGITQRVQYVNQFLDDVKKKIKSFTDQGLTSILFGKKDAEGNVIKNNIFGKIGTVLKMVTDSESFKKIERFILGEKDENGNVIKNNIFGKMSTAIELLTKTESFKKVERFIFGEKDENGNVIKNNIFGKMGTAIEAITGSEAFKKIERFIFGEKDENGNVVKNNIFGKIGTIVETVAKSKAYKSVHDFIFGGVDDTGNPIIGLLERIKSLFDSIYNSAPFKAIRKFFGFGEEETTTNTGIKGSTSSTGRKRPKSKAEEAARLAALEFFGDGSNRRDSLDFSLRYLSENVLGSTGEKTLTLLDKIKEKFEELKANHPWIETICNFVSAQIENIRKLIDDAGGSLSKLIENIRKYLFGYDKKKDGILGFFGGKEHVNGLVDNIKETFKSIFDGGKETKKESIFTKLLNVFTGKSGLSIFAKKGPSILSMLKVALASITGINVAYTAWTVKAMGTLHFNKNPLDDLIDGLKSFAESLLIISGILLGIHIFRDKTTLKERIGDIAFLLILSRVLVDNANRIGNISFGSAMAIKMLASAILEIGILIGAFTLLVNYTHTFWKFAGVSAIFAGLIIAIGFAGKLMTTVAKEGQQIKTAAGSFFGIAAILFALTGLLRTLVLSFIALYFITNGKDIKDLKTPLILIGGALVAIVAVLGVLIHASKVLSKAGKIEGSVLGALGMFMAFALLLTTVVGFLTIGKDWKTMTFAFAGIAAVILALAFAMKIMSNIQNISIATIGKSLLAMVGFLLILGVFIVALNSVFSSNNSRIKGNIGSGGPMATLQQLPALLLAIVELAVAMIPISGALKLVSSIKLSMKDCLNFSKNLAGVGVLALAVWGLAEIQARANITSWKSLVPMFIAIGEVVVAAFVLTGALALLGVMGSALSGTILAGFLTLGAIALGILAIMGIMKLGEIAGNQLIDIVVSISGRVRDELLPALSDFTLEDVGKVGILSAIMLGIFTTEALTLLSQIVSSFISIEGIDSMLTDLVTYANKIKNDLLPAVENFTDDDPEKVGRLSKIAKNVFTVEAFQALSNLISNISPSAETESMLTNLVTYANKIKDDLLPAVRDFKEDDLTQLVRLSSLAKNVFTVAAFEKLTELVGKYTNVGNVTGMLTDLATYATTLKETFLPAVSGLTDGDKDKAGLLADIMAAVFVSKVFDTLISFVDKIGEGSDLETIANGLSDMVTDLTPFLESVRTLDESDAKKAGLLPRILGSVVGSQLFTFAEKITSWLSGSDNTNYVELFGKLTRKDGLVDGVVSFASELNNKEITDFSLVANASDAIKSVFGLLKVMSDVAEVKESESFLDKLAFWKDTVALDKVGDALSGIKGTIVTKIVEFQNALETAGINAEYIKNTVGIYLDLLNKIMELGQANEEFPDMTNFENIGNMVVEGLLIALQSEDSTSRVYQAAYTLGLTLVEGLKAGTEVQSPSKAAKRVGQFIADGLMLGLVTGEPMTYNMARMFGENTIRALEDGVRNYADRGVSQHAINMVTEDLLDVHIFDMPDFSTKHRFGHDIIDFDAMEKWMHENFDENMGVDAIHNFIGAYREEQKELAKTITDPEYAALMQSISAGDYGFGGQSIVSALERELGTREAANQAWEDWNALAKGTIKINDKLIKQQKNMPIMTEEQWDEMWAHDEEGRQKRMSGYFDELARMNGTDWRTEAEKEGFDADFIQRMINKEWAGSGMDMESYFRHLAEAELEAEHADKKKSESALSVVGASKEVTETVNAETDALKEYNTATEETTSIYDNLSDSVKGAVDKIFPDLEKKLKENKGKLKISLVDLLKPIAGDEIASILDFVPEIKGFEFEFNTNNLTKDNLGIFFNTLFGDAFGKQEKGFTDYLSMIKKVFEGGNAFENVAKAFNTAFLRAEDTAETMEKMNETGIDPKVDYSGVASFNAYLDEIYKKYELLGEGKSFGSVARSGVERLQNGAKVTEKQAQEIQKILDKGMMTGAEGIKKELEAVGVEWTELLSLVGGSSKVNWTPLTQNKGLDYAETVKELGEAYTITQLMEDSNKGLFGETATERKEAYAAANLDAAKTEELFQEWLKNGNDALTNRTKDNLDLSDAEKEAIENQKKMQEVLDHTPEGAFRSIADFLEGVTEVIKDEGTSDAFNKFINEVIGGIEGLTLSNASDLEKIGNFLDTVRTVSRESTGISTDFATFVENINGSLKTLGGIGGEGGEGAGAPVTQLVTDINGMPELATEKTQPLVDFLNSVTDSAQAISNSTLNATIMSLATAMITVFEGYYSSFVTVGQTIVLNIVAGMDQMRTSAMNEGGAIAGSIMAGFGDAFSNEENQEKLNTATSTLSDSLASIAPDGYAMATSMIDGIIQGIIDGAEDVNAALAWLAAGGQGEFQRTNKAASPAKKYIEFAHNMTDGLVIGLKEGSSSVFSQISETAGGAMDTFSSVISSISDDIESDFADGPVIRPVVDMSDVYNSASNIDAALSRDRAFSISAGEYNKAYQNGVDGNGYGSSGPTFIQNNYSPKPLSRLEIYRQTKNQFAMMQNT